MISLTEKAAKHISNYLTKRGKGEGIRLGVKNSGCSGMAYTLEFVDNIQPEDLLFEQHEASHTDDNASRVRPRYT